MLGVQELGEHLGVDLGVTVADEREDLLLHHAREGAAEDRAREVEEGGRDHLDDKVLLVGEHHSKEGPDDGRLAGAHNHLLHHRALLNNGGVHLRDELALAAAEDQIPRELKDQEARVVRVVLGHVAARGGQDARDAVRLLANRSDEGVQEALLSVRELNIANGLRRRDGPLRLLQQRNELLDALGGAVDVSDAVSPQNGRDEQRLNSGAALGG